MATAQVRDLQFYAGLTQSGFITSTAFINLIMGPRREGKSSSCAISIFMHAKRCGETLWPIPWAIVRDTRANLGSSVKPTMQEWFPEPHMSHWYGKHDAPERVELFDDDGRMYADCLLFGCDSPQDVARFQSLELGGLWLEEVAPCLELSGGIDKSVLAVGITSMSAVPYPRVQLSFNPPDFGHWTVQIWPDLADDPGEVIQDLPDIPADVLARCRASTAVFKIRKGENTALNLKAPGFRERMRDNLILFGHADLLGRLGEGKVGNVRIGQPVAHEYSRAYEVEAVDVIRPGQKLLWSWDPKTCPSAILWRPLSGSYCDVLAAFQKVGGGVQELIKEQIQPWMATHVPQGVRWMHTGDPSTQTPDASTSARSAKLTILELLPGGDEPQWSSGPVGIDDRRNALHDVLQRPYVGGRPWIRIDKRFCRPLITALATGFHYPKTPDGRTIRENWVKDKDADLGEAFMYGCCWLLRRQGVDSLMEQWRRRQSQLARDHRPFARSASGL